MRRLRSYVGGGWYEASEGFVPLVDPCSEEVVAEASTAGLDFQAALDHARTTGREALGELNMAQRAEILGAMSKVLHERRDELITLSLENTGATRKDAKFDIDGGTLAFAHYAALGRELGEREFLLDGEGIRLGRSARFWGQHLLLPRDGVAVHVNAFNFPLWGLAEKAACALLAGMPVISKPATSSSLVTWRCVEILIEQGVVPPGALSLICGSSGNLIDLLGPQDVLAFTGSASTALHLRGKRNLLESSTRVNIEADSLNAAVLAPDVEVGSETWGLFVQDVVREMTQKSGQKCTAVRRIIAPAERLDEVQAAIVESLEGLIVGNPRDASVRMGPLATADQLSDARDGVGQLSQDADLVLGSGERIDGVGNPAGKGFFFGPTLLRARDAGSGSVLHEREVFGPVSTLIGYDGSAERAASLVGFSKGSLVTSMYSDDAEFCRRYVKRGGATSGRLYIGSEKVAPQLPGSGVALPALLHGGPGRAGGGEELGDLRGLNLYLQRVAVSGDRALVERLAGLRG